MRTVLALVIAGSLAGVAVADDSGKDRKARAAALVDDATTAQAAGDYATAIAKLHEAYELIPHPDLLFNLGQAHRLAGEPWDALDEYERYLAVEPKGSLAKAARQHVAALKKQLAGQTRPVAPPPPIVAPPPTPAVVEPTPTAPAIVEPPPPPPRRHADVPGWRRPVALGVAITGLAAIGAGAYFGLEARRLDDELSTHAGPWTDADLAKQDQGKSAETRAIIGLAAGGALVVSGVVLFALDQRARGKTREVAVVPSLTPTSAGLVVRGAL